MDYALRRVLDPFGIFAALNYFLDGVIDTYRTMSAERQEDVLAEIHCPCGCVWIQNSAGQGRCPGCVEISQKKFVC